MTFGDQKKQLREILRNNPIGYDTNSEETEILSCFFRQYHPDWYEKTHNEQVKVYHIIAETTHCSNGRCFQLELFDGYKDDIGFGSLTAKPRDFETYKRSNIVAACREAVRETRIIPLYNATIDKLFKNIPVYSELSNTEISSVDNFHIDHYDLPFDDLVNLWIDIKGKDFLYDNINMSERQSTITRFTDCQIIKDFIEFHDNNTHLRVVTKNENLSILKRKL